MGNLYKNSRDGADLQIPENSDESISQERVCRQQREDIGKQRSPQDSEESAVITLGFKREASLSQVEDRLLRILNFAMLRDLGLFKE